MRTYRVLATAMTAALVAGCSGGGGQSPAPSTPKSSAPGTPSQSGSKAVKATLTFKLPGRKASSRAIVRHGNTRDYVSPGTMGAIVTATDTNDTINPNPNSQTDYYDLSSSSTICTADSNMDGGRTCTLNFPLNPDTYNITIATYDAVQTNATSGGNELSVDTEQDTVSASTANAFDFYLQPIVEGFYIDPTTQFVGADGTMQAENEKPTDIRRASKRGRQFSSVAATGTTFQALDPDGYPIDQYSGLYAFYDGPFTAVATDSGDTTGCSSPCFTAANDNGDAIQYPNGGGAPPLGTGNSTNETFTLTYNGGGGVGSGIEGWTPGNAPAGQSPYYGDLSVPDNAGNPADTDASGYKVPNAYLVPLFSYVTDGNGNVAAGSSNASPFYVWAAQEAIPDGAPSDGSGYTASIATPGDCADGNGNQLVTVAATTPTSYYTGYGAVFTITPNMSGYTGSCTITLTDGGGDTVTTTVSIGTPNVPITVPAPVGSPTSPSNFVHKR